MKDHSNLDLEQELRRLNLALAAQTRLAYEGWSKYHGDRADMDPDERKRHKVRLEEIDKRIATLETERDLVSRAVKYERLAKADDEPGGPTAEERLTVIHDLAQTADMLSNEEAVHTIDKELGRLATIVSTKPLDDQKQPTEHAPATRQVANGQRRRRRKATV